MEVRNHFGITCIVFTIVANTTVQQSRGRIVVLSSNLLTLIKTLEQALNMIYLILILTISYN